MSPQRRTTMATAMDDLQSKDHRDLLDIIDQLRSQGCSRYIDLPEIIVCGDQSAGKSSVLEAISGMSFPTKDNLCTRFATELILRRQPVTSVKISITPGDERLSEEKDALVAWQPSVDLDHDGLEAVVEEAKTKMNLSTTRMFCNDILRVELSGPNQPHLTMVDLPGLFRAGNREQSADNVELVRDMVARYMNRPRSIILAVVSAKVDYVLQEVTALAKLADPNGSRTIGLITKPDTLDAGSDSEESWVKTALNQDVELALGWHVLKNRSYNEKEFTSAARDAAEEDFFSQGIWTQLDPECCAVKSLKVRLSSILKRQIVDQLPSLVADVETGIGECNAKLARLGEMRDTPEQQLRYLTRLSQNYSTIMAAAVQGNYNDTFFGDPKGVNDYSKRLRAVVQNRLEGFAAEIHEFGQSQVIVESDTDQTHGRRGISRSDYIDHVKALISRSRGRELPGLFNPDIINDLFAQQCRPWRRIATVMTQDILDGIYQAADSIVRYIAADDVVDEILSFVNAGIAQCQISMNAKIDELLRPHDCLHAITYNDQLTKNVKDAQRSRRHTAMENKIHDTFGSRGFRDADSKVSMNPAKVAELLLDEIEPDMGWFGSSIAVDYMQAYYDVALDRFIDDVSVIAVEERFVEKLPSLLTPYSVLELQQDDIKRLVGESEETARARIRINDKLRTLQEGLQVIKSFQRHRNISLGFSRSVETASAEDNQEKHEFESTPATPHSEEGNQGGLSRASEMEAQLLRVPSSQFAKTRGYFDT